MPTYQSRNPRARSQPLRSLPLSRPAVQVFGYAPEQLAEMAKARKLELARFTVTNAEAAVADARRRYVEDRRAIGDANRGISRGLVVRDRRLARSLAFSRFNKTMAYLRRSEAQLVAAQAALADLVEPYAGLPLLACLHAVAAATPIAHARHSA